MHGIATIEDIIEEIVGDINDEYDDEQDIPKLDKKNENIFIIDGRGELDQINEKLNLKLFSEISETIGGLFIELLGFLPEENDTNSYKVNFDKNIIGVCGTKSGRDTNKIKDLNLTLIEPEIVDVPAIKELSLTLECKVIYKQKQDENAIPKEIKEKNYPENVSGDFYGANRDYHTAYYGEIVSAYIIE